MNTAMAHPTLPATLHPSLVASFIAREDIGGLIAALPGKPTFVQAIAGIQPAAVSKEKTNG